MNCKTFVELVTEYLEGALDKETRRRFDEHLALCPGCADYLDQIRVTVHKLEQLTEESLDPTYRDRLLSAFRDWRDP
ncbi:MAG TPA: zf-HC2 domain-containing protein [Aldersonia sp.]